MLHFLSEGWHSSLGKQIKEEMLVHTCVSDSKKMNQNVLGWVALE